MNPDTREHQQLISVESPNKNEPSGAVMPLGVVAVGMVAAVLFFGTVSPERTQMAQNNPTAATQNPAPIPTQ